VGLLLTSLIQDGYRANQKIKDIEEIRDDIIYEKLKNHKDILKRCEEVGIFKHKKD
jgi:hypothetical protein